MCDQYHPRSLNNVDTVKANWVQLTVDVTPEVNLLSIEPRDSISHVIRHHPRLLSLTLSFSHPSSATWALRHRRPPSETPPTTKHIQQRVRIASAIAKHSASVASRPINHARFRRRTLCDNHLPPSAKPPVTPALHTHRATGIHQPSRAWLHVPGEGATHRAWCLPVAVRPLALSPPRPYQARHAYAVPRASRGHSRSARK